MADDRHERLLAAARELLDADDRLAGNILSDEAVIERFYRAKTELRALVRAGMDVTLDAGVAAGPQATPPLPERDEQDGIGRREELLALADHHRQASSTGVLYEVATTDVDGLANVSRLPIPLLPVPPGTRVRVVAAPTSQEPPEGFAPAELLDAIHEPTPHGEPLPDQHTRLAAPTGNPTEDDHDD